MTSITTQIVGAYFRPPAKQVLAVLPAGAKVLLRPEPDNPYDPKAVRVFVLTSGIPSTQHGALEGALVGTGSDLSDVLGADELFVGFVPDSDGKVCKKEGIQGNREVGDLAVAGNGGYVGWTEIPGVLGFGTNAKGDTVPTVTVTVEPLSP